MSCVFMMFLDEFMVSLSSQTYPSAAPPAPHSLAFVRRKLVRMQPEVFWRD